VGQDSDPGLDERHLGGDSGQLLALLVDLQGRGQSPGVALFDEVELGEADCMLGAGQPELGGLRDERKPGLGRLCAQAHGHGLEV